MATATKKADGVKAEALDEAKTIEHDGESYTITQDAFRDLDVLEAFEDGRIIAGLRALLGREQWARFRSKKRSADDLDAMMAKIQDAFGIQGN